jgi:hydroxymethylpyrimidine pyrophosphatase-like HAD family hydrolase
MTMIACYESDVLFYAGLSIGLWIASVVGMGCAIFSSRKKSYADQIEEMMFEHIVQQLRGINMAEAFEQEQEQEEEEQEEQEQESEEQEQEQEEQEEHEEQEQEDSESNDADNEQEQDIEYVEETQTEYHDLPDLVEEPVAPVESPSESSDDTTDIAPPSKRARRGRGRGRGRV